MAQFRAVIQGQRDEYAAYAFGDKGSGITANVNGWTAGVRVMASHENGRDVFRIYRTAGSNLNDPLVELVATVTDDSAVQA